MRASLTRLTRGEPIWDAWCDSIRVLIRVLDIRRVTDWSWEMSAIVSTTHFEGALLPSRGANGGGRCLSYVGVVPGIATVKEHASNVASPKLARWAGASRACHTDGCSRDWPSTFLARLP